MADIDKISGVPWDAIATVGGVSKASIAEMNSSTAPSAAPGVTATRWLAGAGMR